MKSVLWPAKAPVERVWATFSYGAALDGDETISSVAITVALKQGDDGSPSAILDGAAQILSEGRVLQRLRDGISGAAYLVRCAATTSTGRILLLAGVLPVEDIT